MAINIEQLRALQVGDTTTTLQVPPISRTTLALYAGASSDHNPMHIDIDFARAAGVDDVFAHGMLSAAYVGRMVTDWAGQARLRSLSARFTGITAVHDAPTCSGIVTERFEQDGETRLRIGMQVANQHGDVKITGQAVIAVI
ncbi:bifunctional enoyl-CoA hydratase/phosphate acetyltransferase [compost metagenome]